MYKELYKEFCVIIPIERIIVPVSFLNHKPAVAKIKAAEEYIRLNGTTDAPIVVNISGILLDGYARYLAAKNMSDTFHGAISVIVRCHSENVLPDLTIPYKDGMMECVFGKHKPDGDEYAWVVNAKTANPASLEVGRRAEVNTSSGKQTVVITRIEDMMPYVNGKKVYRSVIRCL